MQPLISVVIPSYNHGRFLPQTLDSVLSQTGVNLELIVIDDGSSDDSWAIISRYAEADARLKPYKQTNQGAHAAINRGLALAQGEFLTILNSDDRYAPQRLATLCDLANQPDSPLDFIATGLRLIDAEGEPITDDPWLAEYQRMIGRVQKDGLWAALLERNVTVSTSNFFIRRSLYERLGPIRPLRYNMDWDYVLRAYLVGLSRFAWRFDLPLWDYRLHGKNTILGGLPVSAIEANHLVLRSLKQRHQVPAAALAGLRRHYKLIRQQQVAHVAAQRDVAWETELKKAHAGWEITQQALAQSQSDYSAMSEAHDQTHVRLGEALTEVGHLRHEVEHLRHELNQLLNSRSYKLGHALTAPVRRLKQLKASTVAAPKTETPMAPVPSTPALSPPIRIAVHVHVYYVELLDELLDAVAAISVDSKLIKSVELFVSTPHEVETIAATVQARFAQAVVWHCPNQGKDIGPFIDAIHRFDLAHYDLVLKLHGKRSQNAESYLAVIRQLFGSDIKDGEDWRQKLIAPIAGDSEIVEQVVEQFISHPQIGMIGAAQFLCRAPDADQSAYAKVCARLNIGTDPLFFGGTMFWIRGSVLQRFVDADLTLADFDSSHQAAVENTLEHQLERVFGALVQAHGFTVVGR